MSANDNEDDVFETASRFFEEVRAANGFESAELKAWLIENDFHQKVYDQMVANWQMFDQHGADPAILRVREESLADARRAGASRWQPERPTRRGALVASLAAAVVAPAVVATWCFGRAKSQEYVTVNGEQRTVTLADESRVFLDAKTRLRVVFEPHARNIQILAGRAHFEVAKDEKRPFNVTVGREIVTAVGTAFTVELRGGATSVLLVEGVVKVNQNQGSVATQWMHPGDELLTNQTGARSLSSGIDLQKAAAWQSGVLVFQEDTLADAVDRMNNYSSTKMTVEGATARALKISGNFDAGRVERFVDALQTLYPLSVTSSNAGITIRSR